MAKTGTYGIGWHSGDEQYCHVYFEREDGTKEDLFDVTLYDPEVVEKNGQNARDNSLASLTILVERANRSVVVDVA